MNILDGMNSALVVSASQKGADRIVQWLGPQTECVLADSAAGARLLLASRRFGLLIINAPLLDEGGEALATGGDHGAILLVPQADYDAVAARMEPRGVMTLAKPMSAQLFRQAASIMRASRAKVSRLENKLEEVRMVDRAKWALIQTLNLTEAQAHRYIEKQAMDLRKTRREVAENIVKTYEY